MPILASGDFARSARWSRIGEIRSAARLAVCTNSSIEPFLGMTLNQKSTAAVNSAMESHRQDPPETKSLKGRAGSIR
jgi:hypothetical protein